MDKQIRPELHSYIAGVLNNSDCPALIVGGVEDHVHLFFGLSRTMTTSSIVEKVKTSSSKWIKSKGSAYRGFHWQSGYGAFSVGAKDADKAIAYIRDQEAHHRKVSFKEELRLFLRKNEVEFDERYVWD